MTWFKVDDKFHSHAKVARLGDDSDALALWVVAGSWCADQLTDGWVPAFVARRLDPDYVRRAAALVRVGLWEEGDRDGEKGWLFHGWNEEGRQPTAEQVQQERALKTARQQRWREKHRANSGRFSVDGDVDASTDASRDGDVDTAHVDTAPTRPDPTTTDSLRSSVVPPDASLRSASPPEGGTGKRTAAKRERGTRIPDDFALTDAMREWGRANAPHVDGERETVKFVNHFKSVPGQRGVKLDWKRTWENWILKAADEYAPSRSSPANNFGAPTTASRPEWCRLCDERTRMVLDEQEQPERCPRCHPATQKANA